MWRGLMASVMVLVSSPVAAAVCAEDIIEIRQNGVQAQFNIELAVTPAEQAQGLMYRESMPSFDGMLFVYPSPRAVTFWMKNTLIPLDMLFIDETGLVQRIKENATPQSTETIPGGENIQYVLEINGGLSKMLGLSAGAEIRYIGFSQENAVWPC